ncbi:MAG: hypothetical protein M1816_006571 [Peltula sp. TS41687]|nr:MAG: hypothetical protein M1816_006571 [Peltula sp. TS41687]
MRLAITPIFLLGFLVTLSAAALVPSIISYDLNTPDSVITEAKKAIVKAGGYINPDSDFGGIVIKWFTANVPDSVFETVNAAGARYHVSIEPDQEVSTSESH